MSQEEQKVRSILAQIDDVNVVKALRIDVTGKLHKYLMNLGVKGWSRLQAYELLEKILKNWEGPEIGSDILFDMLNGLDGYYCMTEENALRFPGEPTDIGDLIEFVLCKKWR